MNASGQFSLFVVHRQNNMTHSLEVLIDEQ